MTSETPTTLWWKLKFISALIPNLYGLPWRSLLCSYPYQSVPFFLSFLSKLWVYPSFSLSPLLMIDRDVWQNTYFRPGYSNILYNFLPARKKNKKYIFFNFLYLCYTSYLYGVIYYFMKILSLKKVMNQIIRS